MVSSRFTSTTTALNHGCCTERYMEKKLRGKIPHHSSLLFRFYFPVTLSTQITLHSEHRCPISFAMKNLHVRLCLTGSQTVQMNSKCNACKWSQFQSSNPYWCPASGILPATTSTFSVFYCTSMLISLETDWIWQPRRSSFTSFFHFLHPSRAVIVKSRSSACSARLSITSSSSTLLTMKTGGRRGWRKKRKKER